MDIASLIPQLTGNQFMALAFLGGSINILVGLWLLTRGRLISANKKKAANGSKKGS